MRSIAFAGASPEKDEEREKDETLKAGSALALWEVGRNRMNGSPLLTTDLRHARDT
jgi:hypothetical protein